MWLINTKYGKGELIMKNMIRYISSTRSILAGRICLILLVACGIIIQDRQLVQADTSFVGGFMGRRVQAYIT